MMTLEISQARPDRRDARRRPVDSRNLVLVASDPLRSPPTVAGPNGLHCTRVAAHLVSGSAAWCRRLSRRTRVSPRFAEPIGPSPGRLADLPGEVSQVLELMDLADGPADHQEAVAGAIVALRAADAVIVGPIAPDDANAPGLLPHLADLAPNAYRALRPPRELIAHPAFGQVARRFPYIQMSEPEARALGAGAMDLGILAQRLRRLQGDPGEFAITAFGRHGLLWADHAWWEIDPIGDVNESVAGSVFCMAWVVARRFRRAGAAQALAYARAVTIAAVKPGVRD
jgi:hypothetical protein